MSANLPTIIAAVLAVAGCCILLMPRDAGEDA